MKSKTLITNEHSRGDFLSGLSDMVDQGLIQRSVAEVLSKELPAAAGRPSQLSNNAAVALMKVIRNYIDQFSPEDDDDYLEARDELSQDLGMSEDMMDELLYQNPHSAAVELIQHLESNNVDPNRIHVHAKADQTVSEPTGNTQGNTASSAFKDLVQSVLTSGASGITGPLTSFSKKTDAEYMRSLQNILRRPLSEPEKTAVKQAIQQRRGQSKG